MGKGAVKVVLRTRPTERFASDSIKLQEGNAVNFFFPKKKDGATSPRGGFLNNTQEHFTFKYDGLLHNASQEVVYEEVSRPMIGSLLQGVNGTVMAYGQTGAGKTYTMTGGSDFKSRGLVPRTITDLFTEISHMPEKVFEVKVSYMEIYNEKILDLLGGGDDQGLAIQEDATQGISVRGLEMVSVSNEAEALSQLFNGNQRRAVGEHTLNEHSSRSHCIYTIYVKSRSRVESDGHSLGSKLNLVDLAGSERVAKTGSEGSILKEAMYINKSLSFLEQVVIALGTGRGHVPYRQCKLTNYLKDSLGGNCKTVMVANVWGEDRYLEETFSTLKFAARMMKVQNEISANNMIDPAGQIKMLQKQIAELKAELQMQNQLHGKSHIKYDALTDDERFELEKKVQHYLSGSLDEIEVRNLRDVKEYFNLFKACVLRATTEAEEAAKSRKQPDGADQSPSRTGSAQQQQGDTPYGIGDLDMASGFGVGSGTAAKGIRQTMGVSSPKTVTGNMSSPELDNGQGSPQTVKSVMLPDRSQAYEDFKNNEGLELAESLRSHTTRLKSLKQDMTLKAGELQEMKTTVEAMKREVDDRVRMYEGDEMLDAESLQVIEDFKKKKLSYRDLHEELMGMKTERESVSKLLSQSREMLVTGFQTWYAKTYSDGQEAAPAYQAENHGERLDEGEQFDRMEEERLLREDPSSLEFYRAQRMTRKPKRGAGWVAARPVMR